MAGLLFIMKTYAEKLKDPRWQRKRLEVMQRDEFACTECFDAESTLNVHHHYYEKGKNPWDYPDDALTTLCETCHKLVEQERIDILKSITWEVPRVSIHRMAIGIDPHTLADISHAFSPTLPYSNQKKHRIRSCEKSILILKNTIKELKKSIKTEGDKWQKDAY